MHCTVGRKRCVPEFTVRRGKIVKDKMKALVIYAPHDYRIEEVDIPKVGPGELMMKVSACGICAGDIKAFHGGKRIWGQTPQTRFIEAPVVSGHEFFGNVVEVGEGVTDVAVGDMIITEQIVPCNECKYCREGKYWMCKRHYVTGFKQDTPGGYAEYCKINKNGIKHKLPKDTSVEIGAVIEPYACAMHAVERGNIKHTDVVVVSGLGCIGLGMVTISKRLSPKLLIGIDLKQHRLDKAMEFGADYVFNPMECDVDKEIKKLTDGYGCNVYIEASGTEKSVEQGLNAIANFGTFVQFGVFADLIKADWNIIGDTKEINIHGSHLSAHCYKAVIEGILDGSIKTNGVISHIFNLEDWQKAFETAEKNDMAIKVALMP